MLWEVEHFGAAGGGGKKTEVPPLLECAGRLKPTLQARCR